MQVIYTGEELPKTITKSLMLCGPSKRPDQENNFDSWRKDALQILTDKGYDGVVFCPEPRGFEFLDGHFNYDDQIEWEELCLNVADVILFYVPRDLSLDDKGKIKLAALTTNIEAGHWLDSGKTVYGAPKDADNNRYLEYYAKKFRVPIATSLVGTIENALEKLGEGVERSGGERFVPLFVWNTPSFQSWYQAQTKAGNRLEDGSRLLYTFRPGYKDFVFLWILHAKVYVEAENRVKSNEIVIARTDISSVCLYKRGETLMDTQIILVKEFRSPASTPDGFIWELIGGSSNQDADPKEVAAEEVFEETGFHLAADRMVQHESRQLAGTFSAHHSHLFSAEITEKELEYFKREKDIAHGNIEDSEMTFIEVKTVKEILNEKLTDWTTLGQIFSVLQ